MVHSRDALIPVISAAEVAAQPNTPCTTCSTTEGGWRRILNEESLCHVCSNKRDAAWRAKMGVRQDPSQFDTAKLINVMLSHHWMHECEIIPAYMPPYPREDTRPACQVVWREPDGSPHWLRHSAGPLQGYFWDCYGDDFLHPELALVALSRSPAPPRIDFVIPTHGC